MASNAKPGSMGWFKFHVGTFLGETTGLPAAQVGIYARLIALYWASGNKLTLTPQLKRRINVITAEDEENLDAVIDEFFDTDAEGQLIYAPLDEQLDGVVKYSVTQSENGKKGGRRPQGNTQARVHSDVEVEVTGDRL